MQNYIKTIALALSLLIFSGSAVHAQSASDLANIPELITQIMQIKDFKNLIVQKDSIEAQTKRLAENPRISLAQQEELKEAYTELYEAQDKFVNTIIADLRDYKTIEKMVKNPERFAVKYSNNYLAFTNIYTNSYKPVYTDIEQRMNSGAKGFPIAIIIELIPVAIEIWNQVAAYIKDRKEIKEAATKFLVDQLNRSFKKQLHLKKWDELVKYTPTVVVVPTPAPAPNPAPTPTPTPPVVVVPVVPTPAPPVKPVDVPTPVINGAIEAELQFRYRGAGKVINENTVVPFAPVVGGKTNPYGKPWVMNQVENTVYKDNYLIAQQAYTKDSANFQLKMKVKGNLFLYAFGLQSDNTTYMFYPYDASCPSCKDWGTNEPLAFPDVATYKDADGYVVVPGKNSKTGAENYLCIMHDTPIVPTENFVILLSRSELDMKDLQKKIQQAQGKPTERLEAALGVEMGQFKESAIIENGTIKIKAGAEVKVLPLVFLLNTVTR